MLRCYSDCRSSHRMYISILYILILVLVSSVCESARILAVFPTPCISHQLAFRPLTQELAKRGHEVVVITPDPAFAKGESPKNLIEIDMHDISYNKWRTAVITSTTTSGKSNDIFAQTNIIMTLLSLTFETQMLTDEVQQLINNKTNGFDLILAEACVRPVVSLSHVFKVPVILVSSFSGLYNNYYVMGVSENPPLIYPTVLRQRIYHLSLWEKITELYNHYRIQSIYKVLENEDNKVIKRLFGSDAPHITELENNVHMMFLNVHSLWDSNRPVPPSVVYMGGMHQRLSKELPRELKSYLDSSKNGVIYISFGTNVSPSSLPLERIQMLIRVFSKLPYDVLWKWDKDVMPGKSKNIKISKWLPQFDLLQHPKVKLFITQGGLQSTDEAITAGVPLIGMPMLADQWYNVEQYVYHKIGIRLDMETLTDELFLNGINSIINDDSYHKNIVKLGKIMRDQPQPPLERAVWWTEHVLRHGGASHLRPRVANMSWAEYLDVELIATLGLALVAALLLLIVILYQVLSFLTRLISSNPKLKSQ